MVNTDMVFPLGQWLDEQAAAGKLTETAYEISVLKTPGVCLDCSKDMKILKGKESIDGTSYTYSASDVKQ